jgi:N-acetylneuraminic acid mutarotase
MNKYLLGLFILVLVFSIGFNYKKAFAVEELTVTKICSPASCTTPDTFPFTITDSNNIISGLFTLNNSNNYTKTFSSFQNAQTSTNQQPTNTYTITENTPSGWSTPTIDCGGANIGFNTPTLGSVTFDYTPNAMEPLAHITCNFTNTKQAVVEKDVCINIEGVQSAIPVSYIADTGGNCTKTVVETDLCKNIEGNQTTVPTGYTADARGNCTQKVVETDLCKNIEGNQTTVPTGYTLNAATGQCNPTVPPPRTATLNIQSTPAGVHVVPDTCCFPVTAGTPGITNWVLVNVGNMATQSFTYPKYADIGGVSYTLNPNSLTGCNQGTSGLTPDTCSVSVALGATGTISATYSITPPLPTCPASAANLVRNPGFETVQLNQPRVIYAGSYAILDPTGTPMTEVQDWTRMDHARLPRATDNPGGYGILLPPFEGLKVALMKSFSWGGPGFTVFQGYHPDGIVGTLSTPTTVGSTYLVSAEISTEFVPHAPSFEMWLRSSTTGADSAHIMQVVLPQQATHWTLFAGVITASDQYDRVVISYNQGKDDYPINGDRWAQVDDVHACQTATTVTTPLSKVETPALEKKPGFFVRTWNWFASPFVHTWNWVAGLFGGGDKSTATLNPAPTPTPIQTSDCKINAWTQKADFGGQFKDAAVGFSIGTKGYIGTGASSNFSSIGTPGASSSGYNKDFWEYDSVLNIWTQKADFAGSGKEGAVGFSIGNKGYIGTGSSGYNIPNTTKDFWEYDPALNTWTRKADFPGNARYNAVGFSIGNKGYIGTGNGSSVSSVLKSDFWEYTPGPGVMGGTWTQKANFGGGLRAEAIGFSIGNKGYIGTGFKLPSFALKKDFWEYDPSTNIWTQKADFGGGLREDAVGFSVGTKGYIGTGISGSTFKSDFWEYDPAINTWIQKIDFGGGAKRFVAGFSIGNKGYIGTGISHSNNSNDLAKDFWEYCPGVPLY